MPGQFIDNIPRSDFSLPAFQRISWVSDQARAVWEPRLRSIQQARPRIFALAMRKEKLPDCCSAFQNMLDDRKLLDSQLAQSLNTAGAIVQGRLVQISAPGIMNTLPARLDVLPFAHTPCSMDCQGSRAMAEAWIETARANGFSEAMGDLETLLSWPMEWSTLHGIAELRLPILKMVANSDATAQAYRVQIVSDNYPDEGVSGLHFPFLRPHSAKVTDSKSFKAGLSQPIVKLNGRRAGSPHNAAAELVARQQSTAQAILPPKPRRSFILDETLKRLHKRLPAGELSIEAIFLGNPFNVIRLSDGSTGACMNYFQFKSQKAAEKTTESLVARLPGDPLLTGYLNEGNEPDLLQLSLKTCLVSAMSRKLLEKGDGFRMTNQFTPRFFPPAESAVVIGFGGYMNYLIHMTDIKRIHISDLWIWNRTRSIRRRLELYKEMFPEKVITFSDGSDDRERLASADLVSITASALCNGTMDQLLEDSRDCKTVIVQGQSGAIFPEVLFEKGVSLVSTTVKPPTLLELAQSDPQKFRELLEGKLPIIYMEPLA